MINNQTTQTPDQLFADYLDNLTLKDYPIVKEKIKTTLGWSGATFRQKRIGVSLISPAEQIALNAILKITVF